MLGELVDLAYRLHHGQVKVSALLRQVVGRGVEAGGQIPRGREQALAQRQVAGVGRQLVDAVKEIGDGSSDVAVTAGEVELALLEGSGQTAELPLALGLLLYAGFENGVANAFHILQGHTRAERERINHHRIARHQHGVLPGVARCIDVGDVVGCRLESALFGNQAAQGTGQAGIQARHGSDLSASLLPARNSQRVVGRQPRTVDNTGPRQHVRQHTEFALRPCQQRGLQPGRFEDPAYTST